MENAADVHVELVELVDGARRPDVPQNAVVQNQLVGGAEGGAVPLVVVGQRGLAELQDLLPRVDVVDLEPSEDKSKTQGGEAEGEELPEPLGLWCR